MSKVLNIQSGSVTFLAADTSKAVTVALYDSTQTMIYFTQRGGGGINSRVHRFSVVKTDSTTITFAREIAAESLVLEFFMVEFDSTVDVQDFTRTGDGNVIISAVDLTTSWNVPSWTHGSSNLNNDDFGRWFFNIPTLPGVLNGGTDTTIQWDVQVIDYPDCDLQHFVLVGPVNWSTLFFTKLVTSVDLAKTMIEGTVSATSAANSCTNEMHRLDMSGSILFRLRRGDDEIRNVIWNINVIEFTDNTVVQELDQVTTIDQSTFIASITTIELAKASILMGAVGPWRNPKCANNDRNFNKCSWTLEFLGASSVRGERSNPVGINDISWQVLEWELKKQLEVDGAFYSYQGNEAPIAQQHGGFTRYKKVA